MATPEAVAGKSGSYTSDDVGDVLAARGARRRSRRPRVLPGVFSRTCTEELCENWQVTEPQVSPDLEAIEAALGDAA